MKTICCHGEDAAMKTFVYVTVVEAFGRRSVIFHIRNFLFAQEEGYRIKEGSWEREKGER